jgi:hypothetical protein
MAGRPHSSPTGSASTPAVSAGELAEPLLELNRAIGQPRKIAMILGCKLTKEYKGKPRTVIEDPDPPDTVIRSHSRYVRKCFGGSLFSARARSARARERLVFLEAAAFSGLESFEDAADRKSVDEKIFVCPVEPFVFARQTSPDEIRIGIAAAGSIKRWLLR